MIHYENLNLYRQMPDEEGYYWYSKSEAMIPFIVFLDIDGWARGYDQDGQNWEFDDLDGLWSMKLEEPV